MRVHLLTSKAARHAGLWVGVLLPLVAVGCNPYSTAVKLGVRVVGDVVNDEDTAGHARKLIGQPVAAADSTFGKRLRTLEEVRTSRQMITYPVKDDLLNSYRWAVEAENGRIVALAKLQNNPDGGTDIAEKLLLKEIVDGKTLGQVQSHKYFSKRILTLRDSATGDLLRVFDVSNITDFMGGRYCVLRFDASNACKEIWLVGCPASTPGSSLAK